MQLETWLFIWLGFNKTKSDWWLLRREKDIQQSTIDYLIVFCSRGVYHCLDDLIHHCVSWSSGFYPKHFTLCTVWSPHCLLDTTYTASGWMLTCGCHQWFESNWKKGPEKNYRLQQPQMSTLWWFWRKFRVLSRRQIDLLGTINVGFWTTSNMCWYFTGKWKNVV